MTEHADKFSNLRSRSWIAIFLVFFDFLQIPNDIINRETTKRKQTQRHCVWIPPTKANYLPNPCIDWCSPKTGIVVRSLETSQQDLRDTQELQLRIFATISEQNTMLPHGACVSLCSQMPRFGDKQTLTQRKIPGSSKRRICLAFAFQTGCFPSDSVEFSWSSWTTSKNSNRSEPEVSVTYFVAEMKLDKTPQGDNAHLRKIQTRRASWCENSEEEWTKSCGASQFHAKFVKASFSELSRKVSFDDRNDEEQFIRRQ